MTAIIAASIAATGAIIAALIGVYFLVERKRIGWELHHYHDYSSGIGDDLKLMVRKSSIDEDDSDGNEYRPTEQGYEFVIAFANTGNRDITEPVRFLVEFDESAKVVLAGRRETGIIVGRQFEWTDAGESNKALVTIGFLNRRESDRLLIQTVDNTSDYCNIRIEQPGVAAWRMDRRRQLFRRAMQVLGAAMFVGGAVTIVAYDTAVEDDLSGPLLALALALFAVGQALVLGARWIARWLNRVIG
jgi:hypothetical protein